MGTGIIVCGLNGSGKTALGKALAKKLGFHFIDIEKLFFPGSDASYPYVQPRAKSEVEHLLWSEITSHENFVFSAVKGDYGKRIYPYFQFAVLLDTPKEIRLQRIKERSFRQFGKRMERGGDLYEKEKQFFEFAESRKETEPEEWLAGLSCPVFRVDGEKGIEENAADLLIRLEAFLV